MSSLGLVVDGPASILRSSNVSTLLGPRRDLSTATLFVASIISTLIVGVAASFGITAGLGAIAAIALALVVLRYPVVGAYMLVAGVPVLSGLKRGVPVPGLRPSEALVVFVAVLVLIPAFRREVQPWAAVDWLAFAYALASVGIPVAHLLVRNQDVTLANVSSMFLPLQFFLLYRTVRTALPSDMHRRMALQLLLFSSVAVAVLAVVQQLDIGSSREFVKSITGSEALDSYGYSVYARATGPFQHWHPLAGYLTVIILLCVALLLDGQQKVMSKRWLMFVLAAAISALMLSVTFVSMIGVVLGSALLGLWAGKFRKALFWLGVGGAIAITLFSSFVFTRIHNQYVGETGASRNTLVPQTIENRLNVWTDQYIPGLAGRWASGYGPDLPPDVSWAHTESVYVTLLLRGGLPLLGLFVASMLAVSSAAKRQRVDPQRRPVAETVIALVAVLWIMQLLFPYFTSSGLPQPFWVLVGALLAGCQTGGMSSRSPDLSMSNEVSR